MGHYLYKEMILYLYGELKYIQGKDAGPWHVPPSPKIENN